MALRAPETGERGGRGRAELFEQPCSTRPGPKQKSIERGGLPPIFLFVWILMLPSSRGAGHGFHLHLAGQGGQAWVHDLNGARA